MRFTQKFVIYNKLPFSIVIREPNNFKEEFLLKSGTYFNANFRLENTKRQLQCRVALPEEIDRPKQHTGQSDTQSLLYSFNFSNMNIDDFQIKLPRPRYLNHEREARWDDVENGKIVRVTITNDKEETSKMYTIISQAT